MSLLKAKSIVERARGDGLLGRGIVVVVVAASGEQAAEGGHSEGYEHCKDSFLFHIDDSK